MSKEPRLGCFAVGCSKECVLAEFSQEHPYDIQYSCSDHLLDNTIKFPWREDCSEEQIGALLIQMPYKGG